MHVEAKVAVGDTTWANRDFDQAVFIAPEDESFHSLQEEAFSR
jgi:hypothetical protein